MDSKQLEKLRESAYDELHNWYSKHNERFNDIVRDSETQIDKLIISISSGAIILSVNFYKDIISKFSPWITILLKSSWGFFLISIISVLISYRFSIRDFKKAGEILNSWYAKVDEQIARGELSPPDFKNKYSKTVVFLNVISLFFLVLGLISSVGYAFLSL